MLLIDWAWYSMSSLVPSLPSTSQTYRPCGGSSQSWKSWGAASPSSAAFIWVFSLALRRTLSLKSLFLPGERAAAAIIMGLSPLITYPQPQRKDENKALFQPSRRGKDVGSRRRWQFYSTVDLRLPFRLGSELEAPKYSIYIQAHQNGPVKGI